MTMTMTIPYPVLNIIFQYYAELCNHKWTPLLDHKTGKLIWKLNMYNKATSKMQKVLQMKIENPPTSIPLLYGSLACDAIFTIIKKLDDKDKDTCKLLLNYKRNGHDESCYISLCKNDSYSDSDSDYYLDSPYSAGKFLVNQSQSFVFRDYLPDPNFWATNIKDFIWNDYGITLINNDYMDAWEGEWILLNNEWRFNVIVADNYYDEQEQEPNDDEWDYEWDNDDNDP